MKTIGNVLWFILVGIWSGLAWILVGILWCITILGIPVGVQCFKFAEISFFPFKKDIEYGDSMFSVIVNIIWLLTCGLELALAHLALGIVFCITIIGIPFGKQLFKIAKLCILPFGAKVIEI